MYYLIVLNNFIPSIVCIHVAKLFFIFCFFDVSLAPSLIEIIKVVIIADTSKAVSKLLT